MPGKLFKSEYLADKRLPLRLIKRDPQEEYQLHDHEFSELVIVYRGQGEHVIFGENRTIEAGDVFLIHNRKKIPAELPGVDVVVFGHSHRYVQEEKGGLLWLNPGSCGPRRFHQEITMMMAEVSGGRLRVEKITIPHQAT